MNMSYDKEADAAYIYLIPKAHQGKQWVRRTQTVLLVGGGTLSIDFDAQGKIGGLEILDASHTMPAGFVEFASE